MKEKIDEKGESSPTPILWEKDLDEKNYDCIDCSSLIEILSINEENNNVKFRYINNHKKEILIKEYLKHIEKNKDKIVNEKCELHNQEYTFFCFDCRRHICNKCIKVKKEHHNHKKEYILEVQPDEEDLERMRKQIKEYKNRIEKIKKEKMNEIEDIFIHNIKKENNKLKHINNKNKI